MSGLKPTLATLLVVLSSLALSPGTHSQTPEITIIINSQQVRFTAPAEVASLRLEVFNRSGDPVFDSGVVGGPALDWPMQDQQGAPVGSGLYAYTLTITAGEGRSSQRQQGHVIVDRASNADRVWVTTSSATAVGTAGADTRLTVVGEGEATVGGVELPGEAARTGKELPTEEGGRTSAKQQGEGNTGALADQVVDGDLVFTSPGAPTYFRDIRLSDNSGGLRFFGANQLTTSPAGAAIQFFGNNAAPYNGQLYLDSGALDSAALIFRTAQTGGTITERMRVTSTGNVGIGTNTPTSKLEIAAQDGLAITGFQPFLTLRDTNAGGARSIIAGGNGDFGFYPNSFIGGNPAVLIKNGTGNVGIGTPTPRAKLDVAGDVAVTKLEVSGDAAVSGAIDIGLEVVTSPLLDDVREMQLDCPAGKRVLGGGCWCGATSMLKSHPNGKGWYCLCDNGLITPNRIKAYTICARVK